MKSKKNIYIVLALSGSIAMADLIPVVSAQTTSGHINIDIRNVAKNLAENLKIDASQIPSTVQAPIDVAANVCHIAAKVLVDQVKSPGASCTAEATSPELNQIVQQQVKSNKRK